MASERVAGGDDASGSGSDEDSDNPLLFPAGADAAASQPPPCFCMPYAHRRLWWWPLNKWVKDSCGVSTASEVCDAVRKGVQATASRLCAFWGIYQRNPALFGFYLLLGLMGTIPGLTGVFLLKDTFGLQPETMKVWGTCVILPWSFKLVFAFASDRWTLWYYHRRFYIVVGSILGFLGWFVASLCVLRRKVVADAGGHVLDEGGFTLPSFATFTLAMVISNLGIAWADACVNAALMDYIVITHDAPGVQSVKVSVQSLGSLVGVLLGSWAVTSIPAWITLLVMAGLCAGTAVLGVLIPEKRSEGAHRVLLPNAATAAPAAAPQQPNAKSLRDHLLDVWGLVKTPRVRRVLMFLIVVTLPPDSGTAMFYFLTERLHFTRGFISIVSIVSAVCGIFGAFLYFAKLQAMPFRTLFIAVFAVCSPLGFMQIMLVTRTNAVVGIPDKIFLLGDDALQAITVSIIQTPILVIIANACPAGLEGTAYELVNSVSNACLILSSFLGAWLMDTLSISRTNFDNLVLLLLLTNTLNMLPIAFTWCLPSGGSKESEPKPDLEESQDQVTQSIPEGAFGILNSEGSHAHSREVSQVTAGILLASSLTLPPDLLEAVSAQRAFLGQHTRRRGTGDARGSFAPLLQVRATTGVPTPRDWGLRAGLVHAGKGIRVQPFRPGDRIVDVAVGSGTPATSYHYAVYTANTAHDVNAVRASCAGDDHARNEARAREGIRNF